MKTKIYIFISVLCILSSCHQKAEETKQAKEITLSESGTSADEIFNFATDKRYVSLETTDESLFTEITQLFCTQDEIFIFDIYSQSIYVFDHAGKFLRKLHKTGTGPGEYAMMTAITVNEETGRIAVINAGINIIFYNIHTFNYMDEQRIEAISVEEDKAGRVIAYNALPSIINDQKHAYHLIRYNKEGNVDKEFLPIQFESGYLMRPAYRFYKENDRLFAYMPFSPDIYEINENECSPVYTLKYGDFSFPPLELLKECQKKNENHIRRLYTEQYVYNVQLFPTHNLLVTQFNVGSNKYIGFCNKETGNGSYCLLADTSASPTKINYFQLVGSWNDHFISWLKPSDLTGKEENMDEELQKMRSTLSEESNPILLFFQLDTIR